jgi:hypothetical protein
VTDSRLTLQVVTVLHRLGFADEDEVRIRSAVMEHIGTADSPQWMEELFDAILTGRPAHSGAGALSRRLLRR